MKADWGVHINDLFSQNDVYNSAMHTYDYYWGADEVKMNYAMELLWAAKMGATGATRPPNAPSTPRTSCIT